MKLLKYWTSSLFGSPLNWNKLDTKSFNFRHLGGDVQGTTSKPSQGFLGCELNNSSNAHIFGHNSRLENVRATAEFLQRISSLSLSPAAAPQLSIIFPEFDVTQKEYEVTIHS